MYYDSPYYYYYYDTIYYDPCYDMSADGSPDSPYARVPEFPFEDAEPQDVRYRDMCVAGSDLNQSDFDPQTGNVNAPDLPLYGFGGGYDYGYGYEPDSLSVFEQQFVGNVSGAKPPKNKCMPMKDTDKINITIDPSKASLAFHYFMNLEDRPFFTNPTFGFDAHGASNYYRDKTFFIGGALGCPDIIDYVTPPTANDRTTIPLRAKYQRFRAENCYNFYILNRALKPQFALERPEEGTDDPYTMVDPDRAFHNSCQPLAAGFHVRKLQNAAWADDPEAVKLEKEGSYDPSSTGGFSKVRQFDGRPDLDEAEYMLSTYLQKSWDRNFVTLASAEFKLRSPMTKTIPDVGLPCIVGNAADSLGDSSGGGYGLPLCDTPPPDSSTDCTPPYFPPPPDKPYISRNQGDYYCPNVEKITEPTHPFTPRPDVTNFGHRNDRSYSSETSKHVPKCPTGSELGYTNYLTRSGLAKYAYPVVQCAIVPVDILSFRKEQFDICIMQRINHNFNDWIAAGYPRQLTSVPPNETWEGGWKPPCKTRYWEFDGFGRCPVKYSIQQCCRIIVKDVVPANFLKMRTCEGLMQGRRDDVALQGRAGNPNPPITHITDDTFGGYLGHARYTNAKLATYYLNTKLCDGSNSPDTATEPDEYRFDYWFRSQRFSERRALADPPVPPAPDATEYLGIHMPYMRWWDTGVSAGNPRHGGSFVNTLGSFDVIVGIGREERDEFSAQRESQRAQIRGAPSEVVSNIAQPHKAEIGRIGGWAELKAHQMQSVRRNNLYCLGRYERLFKPGGGENFVLAKAGAGYTSREGLQWPWSLGWRGYVTDTHSKQFPRGFPPPAAPAMVSGGLDNVLSGDIIIYEINGLKQIAYVADIGGYALEGSDDPLPSDTVGVFDFAISRYRMNTMSGPILHPTRIFAIMWDQGKFPSSTGISLSWGMGPERTIYKLKVPASYQGDICRMDLRALTDSDAAQTYCKDNIANTVLDESQCRAHECQPSCVDNDYSACVLPNSKDDWDIVKIYRPYKHVRRCDGTPSDPAFNMTATYDWIGNTILKLAPPDPAVIYQGMTQQVDTDLWAYCVNSGYDPPHHYSKDYKGPQTGALTDTTLCAANWWEDPSAYPDSPPGYPDTGNGCSSTADRNDFFPKK